MKLEQLHDDFMNSKFCSGDELQAHSKLRDYLIIRAPAIIELIDAVKSFIHDPELTVECNCDHCVRLRQALKPFEDEK